MPTACRPTTLSQTDLILFQKQVFKNYSPLCEVPLDLSALVAAEELKGIYSEPQMVWQCGRGVWSGFGSSQGVGWFVLG